ncbi:MAG: OmpA family protein, partial [Acidobacteria bacterium]|nr:OmpA family protein [Acidobacteriota bacterium]
MNDLFLKRFTATLLLTSMWANVLFAAAPAMAPAPTVAPAPARAGVVRDRQQSVAPRRASATESAAPAPAAMTSASAAAVSADTAPTARMAATTADPFEPRQGEVRIFGPEVYVRTHGPKDVYNFTFPAPPWLRSPFRVHIENGDTAGQHRVSSGSLVINGATIVSQSDFNQNVASIDRVITLSAVNTVTITLASQPASLIRVAFYCGAGDRTPPAITVAEPLNNATTNDTTPRFVVKYSDAVGAGESAAAGVDPATLAVLIDNVDRTSLFTKRSDEASAELTASLALADGAHTIKATIRDKAGNSGTVSTTFRVDTRKPTVAITQPASGAFTTNRQPQVVIAFSDETAIDPASVKLTVNGTDVSSALVKTATDARWTPPAALPPGVNDLKATVRDLGTNETSVTSSFRIDVQPPVLTIVAPAAAAVFGAKQVDYSISYSDDQALDLASFRLTVDDLPVTVTPTASGVTGTTAALADGPHTLTAKIADKAANLTTRSVAFRVDTGLPSIAIAEPVAGAQLNVRSPLIRITYSDTQGVDRSTLKVTINGGDVTAQLTDVLTIDGPESQLQVQLPEGPIAVAAEIKDTGGNLGRTASTFLIDVTPPALAFELPLDRVADPKPAVRVRYSDAAAGIDPASLRVSIDGSDVTALFTAGADTAAGTLTAALTDGPHVLSATIADRAKNPVTVTKSFVVDTVLPLVTITAPADNSFVNNARPPMAVTWSDNGTGLDLTSPRLYVKKGDVETDVTSAFTITAAGATGTLPPALALSDGTTQLRATIRDLAGNTGEGRTSFEIDTAAPEWKLETPAPGSFIPNANPPIAIALLDERSGIDVPRFKVSVDAIDRTALVTVDPATFRATRTVPASLAL